MKAQLRRIHPDDLRRLMENARRTVRGQIRLEFKNALVTEEDNDLIPAHWPRFCIPMSVKPIDYDMETLREDWRIPTDGDFWIDVQIAKRYNFFDSDYEPADWIRAEFSNGRLKVVTK